MLQPLAHLMMARHLISPLWLEESDDDDEHVHMHWAGQQLDIGGFLRKL